MVKLPTQENSKTFGEGRMPRNTRPYLLNRRHFVGAALCQAVLSTAPASATVGNNLDYVRKILRSAMPNQRAACIVGARVLETQPQLGNEAKNQLKKLYWEAANKGPKFERNRAAVSRVLQDQIDRDFLADNIILVDGWVMARSEAIFCAVVAQFEMENI